MTHLLTFIHWVCGLTAAICGFISVTVFLSDEVSEMDNAGWKAWIVFTAITILCVAGWAATR